MQHCYCTTPSWDEVLDALSQLTECTVTQCADPMVLYTPTPSLSDGVLLYILTLALAAFSWYLLPLPGGGDKPDL